MWYILKPVLKYLAMIIYIVGISIFYVISAILYFVIFFKVLKYGDLNNNEGRYNPLFRLTNDEPIRITKDHCLYYREKNPYDSWIQSCEFVKEFLS